MGKTIAYVGNFRFPDKNASGKRVLGNCLVLKELGYTPVCIGSGAAGATEYQGILCHNIAISNVARVLGSGASQITDLLEKHLGELTAVILYGAIFTQKENCAIIRWCRKNGIAVYYDQVDWFEITWHNPYRVWIRAYNRYVLYKRVIPRCDGVICISTYLANYHGSCGRKTVVIPPLAAACSTLPETVEESDCIRFVYAGISTDVARPLAQWKDRIDLMFAALANAMQAEGTRPFRFDIFGLTKEQYIRMFPEALRQGGEAVLNQLGDRVIFHGLVSNTEAMAGVAEANFTVLIRDKKRSTMSGFPTKVSESVSCGIPVLCSDTSDLRQYIENGVNGYICEHDELESEYEEILKSTDAQLYQMKLNCANSPFYYTNFTQEMQRFLEEQT